MNRKRENTIYGLLLLAGMFIMAYSDTREWMLLLGYAAITLACVGLAKEN